MAVRVRSSADHFSNTKLAPSGPPSCPGLAYDASRRGKLSVSGSHQSTGGSFMKEDASFGLSRREILKLGAGAAAGAGALAALGKLPVSAATTAAPTSLSEMTIAEMQAAMAPPHL